MMLFAVLVMYISLVYFLPRQIFVGTSIKDIHNLDVTADYGFIRSLAGFMAGMLLYLVYQFDTVKKICNSDFLCCIFIFAITFALHKGVADLIFVPGFAILILLLTCNTGRVSTIFNNRVFKFLGEISYSVYMIHFLFIIFLEMLAHKMGYSHNANWIFPFYKGAIYCIIYLLLLVFFSAISYNVLERPSRNYINMKWGGK